jgi:hypothetical protein
MYTSKIKTQYRQIRKARISQGDIFQDLLISIGSGSDTIHVEVNLEYAVVLTQDCDLQQDYDERMRRPRPEKCDKHIDTILICPAYPLEEFAKGTHIKNRRMETFNKDQVDDKVKKNDVYKRYHYLAEDLDNGVPELVIDFKHFFTAPRKFLYSQRKSCYVATINEIYREDVSLRFANFLSRIGLPDNSSS